ncbi:MAG TPA: NADP-dependent oxidoreductase [Streptosporangiaceae bacterium]|jgi:NADPH:quinone reductase|nr:NADP-dependent oxidoreductase [Streptosporangiaceae bacterium]
MRAVILTSFSGLGALELADLPEPTPGEGEEAVSVRAVALGPWDLSAADGYFQQLGGSTAFPQVQGWDFAGQTADGRRVLGFTAQPWMGVGALAEQIAMPAVLLAPLPDGLDWAQGAALPVTALTAWLLNEAAKVSEGDLLLVTGAAGMVGGMATQLARARGARVVAAVRESDAAQAHALGAEATVSTGNGLADELRQGWPDGFNACLDTIGLRSALADVRDGGAYVTTQPDAVPSAERGISAQAVQVQPDAAALGPLAERAATGDITVRVATTVPLAEFRRGYDLLARGGVRGKVVVTIP